MTLELILGDNVASMEAMSDECIDLTVTSPPYGRLRDYGKQGWDFEKVARELYRLTKQGGVVVWVVGDETVDGSESVESAKQKIFFREQCGFNIHDTMIYEKVNFSNPERNRYHQIFEYMFVLSKGKPKTFNPIMDRKIRWVGRNWGRNTYRKPDGSLAERGKVDYAEMGMRFNIWRINNAYGYAQSDDRAYEHPATFPEPLARDQIVSWSNEGDIVFDPFMGSGTTIRMALLENRNAIGIEVHEPYFEVARVLAKEAQGMAKRARGEPSPLPLSDSVTQMDLFS